MSRVKLKVGDKVKRLTEGSVLDLTVDKVYEVVRTKVNLGEFYAYILDDSGDEYDIVDSLGYLDFNNGRWELEISTNHLEELDSTFGRLDKETQKELVGAYIDGETLEYFSNVSEGWVTKRFHLYGFEMSFMSDSKYRLKKKYVESPLEIEIRETEEILRRLKEELEDD